MALIFNGKSSDDYGIHIEKTPVFKVPEKDYDITHVPGRSGDILIEQNSYKNVELEYEVSLGDPSSTFAELKDQIIQWIYPSSGYCQLVDDDDPGYYRMAVYKDSFDITPVLSHGARATLIFNAKPQRFTEDGDTKVTVYSGSSSIAIQNDTNFESFPTVELTGDGIVNVYHGSNASMSDKMLYCQFEVNEIVGDKGVAQYVSSGEYNDGSRIVDCYYDNGKVFVLSQKALFVYTLINNVFTYKQRIGFDKGVANCLTVVNNMVVIGGRLYADNANKDILVYTYNSTTNLYTYNSGFGVGFSGTTVPTKLEKIDNSRFVVSGANSVKVFSYNGTSWSGGSIVTISSNGSIYCLKVFDTSTYPAVAIGGSFAMGSNFYIYTISSTTLSLSVSYMFDSSATPIYSIDSIRYNPGTTHDYILALGGGFTGSGIKFISIPPTYGAIDIWPTTGKTINDSVRGTLLAYNGDLTTSTNNARLVVTTSNSPFAYSAQVSIESGGHEISLDSLDPVPGDDDCNFLYATPSVLHCVSANKDSYYSNNVQYIFCSTNSEEDRIRLYNILATAPTGSIMIINSELADAYVIQNGEKKNRNNAVYFYDGIVPMTGPKYTTFEPETLNPDHPNHFTKIEVIPKWWSL